MELVRQRDHMDCGVACMAMLAGQSYEWSCELAGDPSTYEWGLRVEDIRILLRANGIVVASDSVRAYKPNGTWLTCLGYGGGAGHLVVFCDGQIFDPSNDTPTQLAEFASEAVCQGARIESWRVLSELDEIERLRGELVEARNENFHLQCEVNRLRGDDHG